jgi:hypothetical protein
MYLSRSLDCAVVIGETQVELLRAITINDSTIVVSRCIDDDDTFSLVRGTRYKVVFHTKEPHLDSIDEICTCVDREVTYAHDDVVVETYTFKRGD